MPHTCYFIYLAFILTIIAQQLYILYNDLQHFGEINRVNLIHGLTDKEGQSNRIIREITILIIVH